MRVTRTIAETRAAIADARRNGAVISFVPTMGALHRGHASLFETAKIDQSWCVASIFVNPTQFGPDEDFNRYPRDEANDLEICRRSDVDCVFLPHAGEMYPPLAATRVVVRGLTDHLCGPSRPGHFEGVATIVTKLFNIVTPDRAYFGEKDAQQLAIIRRLTLDLDLPIQIVGCATIREPDGLALSSRNRYLSDDERRRAPAIYRALQAAAAEIRAGLRDAARLEESLRKNLAAARPDRIDYSSVVDALTLQPPAGPIAGRVLIAVAIWLGKTRLIDNISVDPASAPA